MFAQRYFELNHELLGQIDKKIQENKKILNLNMHSNNNLELQDVQKFILLIKQDKQIFYSFFTLYNIYFYQKSIPRYKAY